MAFFKIISYIIVSDHFKTDPANVMKNRPLVAKKQRKFQDALAWLSLSENHEIAFRNIAEKYWANATCNL